MQRHLRHYGHQSTSHKHQQIPRTPEAPQALRSPEQLAETPTDTKDTRGTASTVVTTAPLKHQPTPKNQRHYIDTTVTIASDVGDIMNTLGTLYIVQSLHSAQDRAKQAYFVTLTSSTNQLNINNHCCIISAFEVLFLYSLVHYCLHKAVT